MLQRPSRTFTPEELSRYSGADPSLPIYLAIKGDVFDVSSNRLRYGPLGTYGHFAGRDASRSFVTGCFKTHLTHDTRGFGERVTSIVLLQYFLRRADVGTGAQGLFYPQLTIGFSALKRTLPSCSQSLDHWHRFFSNHAVSSLSRPYSALRAELQLTPGLSRAEILQGRPCAEPADRPVVSPAA
jgi:predicted heme/steroid binding protein